MEANPLHVIRKGQAAIVCQLCENEQKLKWKCLECVLMMCQRCCDKVHPKFSAAKDHTIINIKDIAKYENENIQKPNFTKLECRIHKEQNCCMFCKSCNEIVCPECIAKTHKRHDLVELSNEYDIKIKNLRKGKENIESGFRSLAVDEAELHKIEFLEHASYKRTKKGILSYEKDLSDSVKQHVNQLLDINAKNWKDVTRSIHGEERKIDKTRSFLSTQKDEVNDLLQSHDAMKVLSTSDTFIQSTQLKTISINIKFNHMAEFVPGNKSIVPTLVGSLKSVSNLYDPIPKITQLFTTDFSMCYNLIANSDGSFWINDYKLKQVHKVNSKGREMTVRSSFKIQVNDMSLMPNGDLLLCPVRNQSILKVIKAGTEEIKDFSHSVSPLRAISVHVTHDNRVIIGVKDNRPAFPASGPRKVIVIDQTGIQEQVFQLDNQNKPLFTMPGRIHRNKSNITAVIDWISEDCDGRVVVLNQKGVLKRIYTGYSKINGNDNPFKPTHLLSSPSENFLIVEPINHYLHIINSHGNILTFYNLKELGITFPLSMSFLGHLYIGNTKPTNTKEKTSVYKIDNFMW